MTSAQKLQKQLQLQFSCSAPAVQCSADVQFRFIKKNLTTFLGPIYALHSPHAFNVLLLVFLAKSPSKAMPWTVVIQFRAKMCSKRAIKCNRANYRVSSKSKSEKDNAIESSLHIELKHSAAVQKSSLQSSAPSQLEAPPPLPSHNPPHHY